MPERSVRDETVNQSTLDERAPSIGHLFRDRVAASGPRPAFHFFRGHNHVSTVQSLGSPQGDVGAELLRFLRTIPVDARVPPSVK